MIFADFIEKFTYKMYKYSFFFVLFLSVNCLYGQFTQFPIGFAPANAPANIKKIATNLADNSQTYRGLPGVLPFFEDFSDYQVGNQTLPNNAFWINVGVVINNTRADNAPSLGVATLDAFDIKGTPYNIASPLSQGYSDTLTAKNIDLSAILPTATDVFLSFWWQAGGKVEAPDASDFLLLQGKDNANNWVEIWRKYGDGTFTAFKQENIQLTSNFFHSGFQFRFLRFGRVSGDFDAWHLDYIYLNQNRTLADVARQDVAFSRQPQSYLKNYTAMPVKQYFANQAAEINTEIITNVKNLDNNFRLIDYNCELKNTRTNTVLMNLPITTTEPNIQANDPNFLITATPQTLSNSPVLNTPISLEYAFRLISTDATAPIDFTVNNVIKGKTELDNYFAYDDGTAEYVAGIAQTQGKIAVQYKLNQPAIITDIDISFVPFKQNLSQETFILSIWKKVKGREDEILFQKSLQVKYPTSPNGFVRFAVDSTKIVNIVDTFYVGIQQTSNDLLAIGFDKDNNAQTKTFFNIQGNWEQDPLIKGALMIRPVFDNDVFVPGSVTALNDNQGNKNGVLLFPNPSKANENNVISIKSPTRIASVHIYNTQGQTQEVIFDKENQTITTKNLSKGLYMALLKDVNGKIFSKKIVLE